MTVTAALIAAADRSLSTVEATEAITTYSTIAQALLDQDDPGLGSALYDWCHALMIAHLRATGGPNAGLKSYSSGDYSESRNPGQTAQILQYRQIIENFRVDEGAEATDVTRADATMGDLKFDQAEIPSYYSGGL